MSFSTKRLSSFAFSRVVRMRSWRTRLTAWFRSMAIRCSVVRPSLRWSIRWRMAASHVHAEGQVHFLQGLEHFLERFLPEVLLAPELLLRHPHEVPQRGNLHGAQLLAHPRREVQVGHGLAQEAVQVGPRGRLEALRDHGGVRAGEGAE